MKRIKITSNLCYPNWLKPNESKVARLNAHLKRVRRFIKDCQDKLQEYYCEDELKKVWYADNEEYREFCYYKHQLKNKLADLHDQEHRLLYDIKTIQS